MNTFLQRNRASWVSAIHKAFDGTPPPSVTWTDHSAIIKALEPFMGLNMNHARLPGGGSFTFQYGGELDPDTSNIQFGINDNTLCEFRPEIMRFEYVEESPADSFFLIDLAPLQQTWGSGDADTAKEWVVQYEGKQFPPYVTVDELEAHRTPVSDLPASHTAMKVVRLLRGRLLITAKASHWNVAHGANDNSHDHMTAQDIRGWIVEALEPVAA